MRIIRIYCSIIMLLASLSFPAIAQDSISTQLSYANNLFNSGKYFDAITEFKRLQFFDTNKKYVFESNFKIGQSYKAGAKFEEAIKYFTSAELNSTNNDQKYSAKIEIIKSNILRRTTEQALRLLEEMEKENFFSNKSDSINYWRGWAFMFADNWEKAGESFSKVNPNHELKLLCDGVIKDKVSVTFTKVISYILPGAGQFYTGHYLSGALSLGYNVLLGFLTINSFIEDRVFDGAAVGLLLWLRFYRGNVQNAENFAEEKNIEAANKALRYLQNNYQGNKP